jgi:hypothetical protein
MRKSSAAICAAAVLPVLLVLVLAPLARAVTNVSVRIEGREETLFEGTVPVTIHPVQASSDTEAHDCDGINPLDPENVVPAATATLASVEAMESIGESFDGKWYESLGDYFITRWGPDAQEPATGAYWGILVDERYTSVGGCQYELDESDEVLWIWNAFATPARPTLALYPEAAHYTGGLRPRRVTVAPGEPVPLEVVAFPDGGEGVPAGAPSRAGSSPYEGATVAPVAVRPQGFQRIETGSPEAVVTNAAGKATVSFSTPGVHRIKATVGAPGTESAAVRSNGLEVCVRAQVGDCGEAVPGTTSTVAAAAGPVAAPAAPRATRISKPKLSRAGLAHGRLTVSWKVLDPGAGVKSWRVATKTLGAKGGWVARAHGTGGTRATVRLPRGHRYAVRFTLADLAGHTTTYSLGKVQVPSAGRG